MVIFADTSGIYALLDADDRNHARAKAAWVSWLDQATLLACSNYVLVETIALVQRRLGIEAARRFCQEMAPLFQVYWVDQELHSAAAGTLLTVGARNLSLVDCVSFELMRRMGIRTAFAFDRHFAQQGFRCLP